MTACHPKTPHLVASDQRTIPDPCPLPIPLRTFGKYTLIAYLGHGGTADVFLAVASGPAGFRKPLVVKRLFPHLSSERRIVQMFFDEARLAAKFQHPHVVQTYDAGTIGDACFIAMEYLEGRSLIDLVRQSIARDAPVPQPLVAKMFVDVLDGLEYLHELKDYDGTALNIVHRDISPQNIFITYGGVVKVLDFGVAKATTQIFATRRGAFKGKLGYMAPEQVQGQNRPVDPRTDVWAVGVVLWEVLARRRLFGGASEYKTLELVLEGSIPRLRTIAKGVHPLLDHIVHRALQRDPDCRYASALDMREDLIQFQQETGPMRRADLRLYAASLFEDTIDTHRGLLAALSTVPRHHCIAPLRRPPNRHAPQALVGRSVHHMLQVSMNQWGVFFSFLCSAAIIAALMIWACLNE